jgi:hypothetical protein
MLPGKKGQEFFGAPTGMRATSLEQELDDVRRCAVGATEGPPGPFGESCHSVLFESIDPFVAGLAADAVATAHCGNRIEGSGAVGDEQEFLVHG